MILYQIYKLLHIHDFFRVFFMSYYINEFHKYT
jgi:hypothetical protein